MLNEKDLKIGYIYLVEGPDFNIGIWNGSEMVGPSNDGRHELISKKLYSAGWPDGVITPIRELSTRAIPINSINHNILTALNAADSAIIYFQENK